MSTTQQQVTDYFAFFDLPRKLAIDTSALEKLFYAKSRQLHPDRFAGKSLAEQESALEQSSLLNDAWRTLKDPIARTEYLLSVEGIQLEEQSRNATDAARAAGKEKQQIVPADLLEEVFELNMQLEEMRMAREAGADDPELKQSLLAVRKNFESQMTALQTELEQLWQQWDSAVDANNVVAQDAAKQKLADLLNRRSYIRNLVRDVNQALE
jgi:molecular chaperone HscB